MGPDPAQLADGSWEEDVFTTAQVMRVLRSHRPNLTIIAVVAVPESVRPGTPVILSVTVRNLGPEPSAPAFVAARLDSAAGPRHLEERLDG